MEQEKKDSYGRQFLKVGETYPIAPGENVFLKDGHNISTSRVRATGEKRCPKKGEWFLSGSKIAAYYSLTDMTGQEYHIGKLVRGEVVSYWREIPE